jgi:outer membrane protein assembly factor BamB
MCTYTSSPAIMDGLAFIGSWGGTVDVFDVNNGTLRMQWKAPSSAQRFGVFSSPAISAASGVPLVFFGIELDNHQKQNNNRS